MGTSLIEHPSVGEVTRLSLADALALGPDVWANLSTASTSPFMSWAWHRAWADAAPQTEVHASQVLVLAGPGEERGVLALLPIRARRVVFRRVPVRAVTWAVGDLGCPDHLDVLAAPDADLGALVPVLEAIPWQVLILSNLAEESPNADRLCRALARRGHVPRRAALWGCPRLELPATWDAYLAGLSANRRQIVRRKERGLARQHRVALTDYGESRFDEGWEHLVRLHGERWEGEGGGAFTDPTALTLQRAFGREMARQGRLWLTTLDVDGEAAAAWYGFATGDTVSFYQGGRARRWEAESLGLVLMGAMIRRAIERGYAWFDFLRGEDGYKTQWTATRRHTSEIVVFRSGWRGGWVRALDWVARGTRGHG